MANPKKIEAKVKDIFPYDNHVYMVDFLLEKKLPRFKAGQFLHLTIDDYDPTSGYWPESRVFSISSCSNDRMLVSIVYSVKGFYTSRMEQYLKKGARVWLKAPYGEFVIANHLSDDEVPILIAGGTGISPFIPFIKEYNGDVPVYMFYGVKSYNVLLFSLELKCALEQKMFSLQLYLEEKSEKKLPFENITVTEGILNIDDILEVTSQHARRRFFISGPPSMISSFKANLVNRHIEEQNIIIDEWN